MSYLNPGRTGLLGAPTYPMLRDATLASFLEVLRENKIPYGLNKGENVLVMKDTGSKILLRSVDEFERLRGTNLAWFGLDELSYTQEGAWLRLEGRLRDPKARRHCGFAVWTPKGFDWVYRKFVQSPGTAYETILAKPNENKYLLEHVPDFYERLRASYDENFYRQEVLGDYINQSGGKVYNGFRREANVRPLQMDGMLPIFWALDFNVDPMCSVVVQITKTGEIRVLDEIVLRRATTRMACEAFVSRFPQPRMGIVIYGDASGAAMQTTGSSDYETIREFFRAAARPVELRVASSNPPVRERVATVNSKLLNALDEVNLFVDPRCKELIADLEQVAYVEDTMVINKDKDRKRTHLSDALGYLVCQENRPQIGERNRRLF